MCKHDGRKKTTPSSLIRAAGTDQEKVRNAFRKLINTLTAERRHKLSHNDHLKEGNSRKGKRGENLHTTGQKKS